MENNFVKLTQKQMEESVGGFGFDLFSKAVDLVVNVVGAGVSAYKTITSPSGTTKYGKDKSVSWENKDSTEKSSRATAKRIIYAF